VSAPVALRQAFPDYSPWGLGRPRALGTLPGF